MRHGAVRPDLHARQLDKFDLLGEPAIVAWIADRDQPKFQAASRDAIPVAAMGQPLGSSQAAWISMPVGRALQEPELRRGAFPAWRVGMLTIFEDSQIAEFLDAV